MEALWNAVLGDLVSRSISFLFAKCEREMKATVQEDLQRLRQLLLRGGVIVQEAEQRIVPNKAMRRQLDALRAEMLTGYYVHDVVNSRVALGDDTRRGGGGDDDDEPGRRAFLVSRSNPAKRVCFPSGAGSSAETEPPPVLRGASPVEVELQQVVRSLQVMVGDMREFVMFLTSYPPLYRQPYSAHMFVERCMVDRHMEKETIMEFLLKREPPDAESLDVLPIVGPKHIGKSTLVEHVCNDERVRDHFSYILFYSGDGLKDETAASFRDNCETKHHREDASEERILVVIELLEDADDEAWDKLCSSQRSTARGCKIIVTSRSEKIARFGTTTQPLRVQRLPEEAFWYLFKTAAFGTDDPVLHPKMASLGLEMANVLRGSFMYAYICAKLFKSNFNTQMWSRVLTRTRQYLQKSDSRIGKYHDLVKDKDYPRLGWSVIKDKPDTYFLLQNIYQRGSDHEVPHTSVLDLLGGNNQPQGKYEVLFWKSSIPPYFSYMSKCEIRALS